VSLGLPPVDDMLEISEEQEEDYEDDDNQSESQGDDSMNIKFNPRARHMQEYQ
jgi:hypothetical protein